MKKMDDRINSISTLKYKNVSLKESALAYAEKGLAVFPVHYIDESGNCSCGGKKDCTPGKHPMTKHGHKDATTDQEQIRAWWTRSKNANIGLNCKESGVLVIDTDPRAGGHITLAKLEEDHGKMPETLTALTSYQDDVRGKHRYFTAPAGVKYKGTLGSGIDIKHNGYVILPPSRHPSGICYQWEDDSTEIADLPNWVFDLIIDTGKTAPITTQTAQNPAFDTNNVTISEGGRNNFLTSEAGRMRHFGNIPDAIYIQLKDLNQKHCKPPLSDEEVKSIADSVGRYKPEYNAADAIIGENLFRSLDSSDEIITCYHENKIKLDFSGIPKNNLIKRYIDHQRQKTDAYLEYHHAGACFIISTLIRRAGSAAFRHETIYPNVWLMCLGISSISRKSTAIRMAHETLEAVLDDGSLINLSNPEQMASSFSPEGFIQSMSENPVRYFINDECGQMLADIMQKSYMQSMRDIFCKIYDGSDYSRTLRTKNKTAEASNFKIEKPYLTQLQSTTPGTFAEYSTELDIKSGWFLRFLFYAPSYQKEFKAFNQDVLDISDEYSELVDDFKAVKKVFENHNIRFMLSDDAFKYLQNWLRETETKLSKNPDEIKLAAQARLSTNAIKLAMIYTAAEPSFISNDYSSGICSIPLCYMKEGIKNIDQYFFPTFLEIVESVIQQGSRNMQDKIIAFLKRNSGKCNRSALLRYLHKKAKDIDPELSTLIESDEIKEAHVKGKAGRVEKWYCLN